MSTEQLQMTFERANHRDDQASRILRYLEAGNKITALEALSRFQCFRLASRISQLKKGGHNIQKEMIEIPSGKHVAEYWLER